EEDLFEDGAEPPGTGAAEEGVVGHGGKCVVGELKLDVVELEELAVLLDEGVLQLAQDADEGLLVERGHRTDHRQPADELRDQPELEEILGQHLGEDGAVLPLVVATDVGGEADAVGAEAAFYDLLHPGEGPTADEED